MIGKALWWGFTKIFPIEFSVEMLDQLPAVIAQEFAEQFPHLFPNPEGA